MNELLSLGLLLLLSGVFSGSETALVTLSLARAEALKAEGQTGATSLVKLKNNPSRMLITLLIGNNLVNIGASAIGTVLATEYLGHIGPGIAVGVLTILILIFGEITPKSLATHYAERISLLAAPLILGLEHLLTPLVWVFEFLTNQVHRWTGSAADPTITELELINLAGHGEEEGTIDADEREMIERVFTLNDLKAADVMTPAGEVFLLNGQLTLREALDSIQHACFSRIPIYEGQHGAITKILHIRDVLHALANKREAVTLVNLAFDALFCPENQPIDELLTTLRKSKQHMAVVVDEHGAMQGVVTLEDLLEELVGEIYDESDEPPDDYMRLAENRILVDGSAELRILEGFFGIDLPGKPTKTVSLWILDHLERIPEVDERFTLDGLNIRIQEGSSSHIDKIIVERPLDASTPHDPVQQHP